MREKHIPPRPGTFEPVTPEPTETMRDRIAIKVMERLVDDRDFYDSVPSDKTPVKWLAHNAYAVADAMMKERLK